ncbi:hypothetical protein GCM10010174_19600 [Kutzneria viridogrisea]|uniref:Bacterial transcriptional activator domain-containing protein n=2 Tax=Kutzneria TaxID=43356 RepID=W5WF35_9PSEU|nr:BTAD domain-containing putative transcriptional regulator [Kutzneria albida]AHH99462.1 hypothetical protein KALB_6102 [Kutzneria albida DSM 43870]MBA8922980.1 DNA-binding SARP family transcriptional activator [Kutzneria viridogrisea]
MAAAVMVHLFRGPYVTQGTRRVEVPEASKRLLAFVALHRRRLERRFAAGHLWPCADDARAAANLRSTLWRLRRIGVDLISADKWSLALRPEVLVDIEVAGDWAGRLIDGSAGTEDLVLHPWWTEALDLLPGWYEDWAIGERERLRQRTLHALEALSRRFAALGRCAEAVETALAVVGADPLRESAQRALIDARLAHGDDVAARRGYELYRELLGRELGLAPAADLLPRTA